ncbi:LrgB family protein [Bacillus cereus]
MVLIIITVAIYFLATKLYKKFTFAFTLPVLTVTAIMICLFLIFGISHHEYRENGGDILSSLLSPAIVALAIPLFKERKILMKNFFIDTYWSSNRYSGCNGYECSDWRNFKYR